MTSTSPNPPTVLRAHTPAELLALLPYQFGYQPERSIVITCVDGGRAGLMARVDLPPEGVEAHHLRTVLRSALLREDPPAALVIGYENTTDEALPGVLAAAHVLEELGITPVGPLIVRDDHWFSVDLLDGEVCGVGEPLPEPADVPAVAAFVGRGVSPLATRAEVAAQLAPTGTWSCLLVELDLLRECGGPSTPEAASAWAEVLDTSDGAPEVGDLGDRTLAAAALSLTDTPWRDTILARICVGSMSWEATDPRFREVVAAAIPRPVRDPQEGVTLMALRTRLCALARILPDPVVVEVLALIAHSAWWDGDGTMARVACDRALVIDPDHSMCGLLIRLLDHGVGPEPSPG